MIYVPVQESSSLSQTAATKKLLVVNEAPKDRATVTEVRNKLGQFGLEGQHHEQDINTLSGGQKSRVVFVELRPPSKRHL